MLDPSETLLTSFNQIDRRSQGKGHMWGFLDLKVLWSILLKALLKFMSAHRTAEG